MAGTSKYTKGSGGFMVPGFDAPEPSAPRDYSDLKHGPRNAPPAPDPVDLVRQYTPPSEKDSDGTSLLGDPH